LPVSKILQNKTYGNKVSIYNNKHKACGTADKVEIESKGDFRFIDIEDYKGLSLDTPILTSEGYCQDKQVADNKTNAGRQQNRRTEINVIQ
jgi:hypothetical protein